MGCSFQGSVTGARHLKQSEGIALDTGLNLRRILIKRCPAGNTLSVNLPERIAHSAVGRCLELLAANPEQAAHPSRQRCALPQDEGAGGWKIVSVAGQVLGYLANRADVSFAMAGSAVFVQAPPPKAVTPDKRSADPGPTRRGSSLKRLH